MSAPKTLFDKIWDAHVVHRQDDGTCLIYIDRHLVHEVTSPQAFEGLRNAGRAVRAPNRTLAVADHNVPTTDRSAGIADEESRIQVEALAKNAADFGVPYFAMNDIRQGIVHVIGPEQGFTQPGMTIVCGDSHTATHGAFGALAFGIGTSEVEHVLASGQHGDHHVGAGGGIGRTPRRLSARLHCTFEGFGHQVIGTDLKACPAKVGAHA